MSLTPHGPGFSFLDRIEVAPDRQSARAEKFLDPAAPYFADHFPGNPLMPGVLLIECAAQAAGALWGRPQAYLAGVQQFRLLQPVRPGQSVISDVALEKDLGSLAQFTVTLRVGEVVVAQGKLALSARV